MCKAIEYFKHHQNVFNIIFLERKKEKKYHSNSVRFEKWNSNYVSTFFSFLFFFSKTNSLKERCLIFETDLLTTKKNLRRVCTIYSHRSFTTSNILHALLSPFPCAGAICPGWWRCTIAISPRTTCDSFFFFSLFFPPPSHPECVIAARVNRRYNDEADVETSFLFISL